MATTGSRMPVDIPAPAASVRRLSMAQKIRAKWQLYVLLALPLLYLLVFAYWPMYGVQIAFRNFNPGQGISASPWVGLRHFERFVSSYDFWRTLRNTLVLSLYSLAAGFPFPIMLALGLNYVTRRRFQKMVQLVTYAPYFISTVVMVGIILQLLAPNTGLVNHILQLLGFKQIDFMARPQLFAHIYVWSGLWQTVGFSCVIYLAALSGVDPTLHEAAIVDGASKLQRMWYIDLPEIIPLAILLLILSMGGILSSGFEKILLMQNPLNIRTSDVIDTYVYRVGIASAVPNYSYASAVGLFKSLVGLILVLVVDRFAKRIGQTGAL
jgi:putative aldouronate transport system permease protein